MREVLEQLFSGDKYNYQFFLKLVERESVSTQWGSGVMPAYDLLPYSSELLGRKAGRILKKESEPGRNKQCYYLDNFGKIISEIEYAEYNSRETAWLIYRRFFIYSSDHAIEFAFSSVLETDVEADLNFVKWVKIENSKIISSYFLNRFGEYTELEYSYSVSEVSSIVQKSWMTDEVIAVRVFELAHVDGVVIITEAFPDGSMLRVFPSG